MHGCRLSLECIRTARGDHPTHLWELHANNRDTRWHTGTVEISLHRLVWTILSCVEDLAGACGLVVVVPSTRTAHPVVSIQLGVPGWSFRKTVDLKRLIKVYIERHKKQLAQPQLTLQWHPTNRLSLTLVYIYYYMVWYLSIIYLQHISLTNIYCGL